MAPRIDSPAVRRGAAALRGAEGVRPPGVGDVRRRGRAAGVPQGERRAADRPRRARVALGRAGQGRSASPPCRARIASSTRARQWEHASPPEPAELPAARRGLAGRRRAATEGRKREAAIDFAKYLIGPEVATRVRADRDFPMLPVRASLLGQGLPDPRAAPGVDAAAVVRRGQPDPHRRPGGPRPADPRSRRLPGRPRPGAASPRSRASRPTAPCRRSPGAGPSGPSRSAPSGSSGTTAGASTAWSPPPSPPERLTPEARRRPRPRTADGRDPTTPTPMTNVDAEIKELLGLFDVPAFARRGQDLEYALDAAARPLPTRARHGLLDMVRAPAPPVGRGRHRPRRLSAVFAAPIDRLWPLCGAEPPVWADRPAPPRRRRRDRPRPGRQRRPVQPPLGPLPRRPEPRSRQPADRPVQPLLSPGEGVLPRLRPARRAAFRPGSRR